MSKVYLDYCYLCNESKATIKYRQSIKDPLYCGIMSGGLEPELVQEFDHHIFVVTEERVKADKEAEERMIKDMADIYSPWVPEL